MNFKPILFSTEMVQAILDGRKTMTRRIVKLPVVEDDTWTGGAFIHYKNGNKIAIGTSGKIDNPYGQPGDVLWVRESWNVTILKASTNKMDVLGTETIRYKASDDEFNRCTKGIMKWKPSIHMRKEACRLFLKVTDVRVERLQDITEEDAIAEGVLTLGIWESDNHRYWQNYLEAGKDDQDVCISAKESYKTLWQSINGPDSWEANPWVWVIEFERINKPKNFK